MKTAAIALALLTIVACGQKEAATSSSATTASQATAPANLTAEQLGELGAQIKNEPARADELLGKHGLTHESFEQAIRDVTEDPAASKRYAEAFKRRVNT